MEEVTPGRAGTAADSASAAEPLLDADGAGQDSGVSGLFDLVDLMLRSSKDGVPELGAKEMLEGLVSRAWEVVEGVRWASVTVVRSGKLKTLTSSDPVAERIDAIQYELGSGPCVDAVLEDHVYL